MGNHEVNSDPRAVGARIRELRKHKGWSLDQLAADVNVTKGFLSLIENGKANASGPVLLRLSQSLSASIDYILKGGAEAEPPPTAALAIPTELLTLAAEQGWTVQYAIDVARAQQSLLARRSGPQRAPFTRHEWLEFEKKVRPYIRDNDGGDQ